MAEKMEAPFCKQKLILIGDNGVGKTSVLARFVDGIFLGASRNTIIDMKVHIIQIGDKLVELQIWDTAGQETYRALTKEYYRNTDGIILMYDVTDRETFYHLNSWLDEIRDITDGVTIIVGNKNDCPPRNKMVPTSTGKSFAEERGMDFIETSAETGYNVNELFQTLVRKILEQRNSRESQEIREDKFRITLTTDIPLRKTPCCFR